MRSFGRAKPKILLDTNAVRYCFDRQERTALELQQLRQRMLALADAEQARFVLTMPVLWELTRFLFQDGWRRCPESSTRPTSGMPHTLTFSSRTTESFAKLQREREPRPSPSFLSTSLLGAYSTAPPKIRSPRSAAGNYPPRMSTSFDSTVYTRAPIISVASGITLAQTLAEACPKGADAGVKKAAKHLKAVADKALSDVTERNKKLGAFPDEDSRVLDNEADRAWGALRLRLQALAMITEHAKADAKRAAEVDFALFQGSTEFLKAEYSVQSSRMGAILQHIDGEKLGADLDRLAGKAFLAAVRDIQPRYEAMVKERLRRDNASGTNLSDTLKSLQDAITHYATKVCGMVELDDPKSEEAVRVALLPILNHRQNAASKSQGSGPVATPPPAPVPVPPPAGGATPPTEPTGPAT
jgi:hypothetical protein